MACAALPTVCGYDRRGGLGTGPAMGSNRRVDEHIALGTTATETGQFRQDLVKPVSGVGIASLGEGEQRAADVGYHRTGRLAPIVEQRLHTRAQFRQAGGLTVGQRGPERDGH